MSARSILVAAALFAGLASPAYARGDVFTIKLEAPVAEQTRVITQNTIWTCEEDTCLARPSHAATVRACRQFVRELGARVTAYGPEGEELTQDEIARCNGDAAPAAQHAQN
jgi:hypothetical protein